MTSISASQGMRPGFSPRDLLQSQLTSRVSSGEIAAGDQTALATALDTIDQALESERSSGSRPSRPPNPDEMQSKVEGLIVEQVEAGTLTEDQAEELKTLFEETFAQGPGGAGGPPTGGPGGAGGPPPGPPPGEEEDGTVSSTSSSSDASDTADLLAKFLEQLKEAKAGTTYSLTGAKSANGTTVSILFDIEA